MREWINDDLTLTWALPWLYWPTFEELNRMGTVQRGYLLGVELNKVHRKEAGISQTWWKTYVTSRAFHLVCLGKSFRMGSFRNLTRRFSWAGTLGQHCFIPLACCHGLLLPMLMNHTSWFWRLKLPGIHGSLVPMRKWKITGLRAVPEGSKVISMENAGWWF